MRNFYSVYGIMNITLEKYGFPVFCDWADFSKHRRQLHFKMQVIHIDDVLGGDERRSDPNKR
jgi:hypothetical protein